MRIGIAQINPTVGDFAGNTERIVRAAVHARGEGADLTVFPELSLCGYPPRDLLEKPSFLVDQERALEKLCNALRGLPSFVGFVERCRDDGDDDLYNAVAFIREGRIETVARKCLLPNYDVFDEARYFKAADKPTVCTFRSRKIGIAVCEDAWNDKDFRRRRRYEFDPVEQLVKAGADLLLNPSASPFSLEKQSIKETMLSSLARKYHVPLIHVNQVGGNDELIFDGRSSAFDGRGKLLACAPAFEEGVAVVELSKEPATESSRLSELEEIRRALVLGLRDYARKCGFTGAVLGLSGGVDSAVTAVLAAEAFGPENVMALAMPSRYNAPRSLRDAKKLAENLGIEFEVIPIERPFTVFEDLLAGLFAGREPDATEENLQARLRGVLLMAVANKFHRLLTATGNKSELAVGYCTLYGDMCGGLAPLGDLYKTTVYKLARHLNAACEEPPIPKRILTRPPSAELRENQTDQDSLPPYEVLDGILKTYIEERRSVRAGVALGYDRETVVKTLALVDAAEFKRRQAPPVLKVTAKAFGMGRRMPVAQGFRESK